MIAALRCCSVLPADHLRFCAGADRSLRGERSTGAACFGAELSLRSRRDAGLPARHLEGDAPAMSAIIEIQRVATASLPWSRAQQGR